MGVSFSYPQKQQQQKAILKEIEEDINKLKVRTRTQDPFISLYFIYLCFVCVALPSYLLRSRLNLNNGNQL